MSSRYDERPWLAHYGADQPADFTAEFDSLLEIFAAGRREVPERVALTYFDGRLTYREVDELSNGLAHHLLRRGFAPGDRIALYLQNIPQLVIALLAGWKAGGIVVPLNPMYRHRELSTILADCQPAAVVSSESGWHSALGEVAAGVRIPLSTSELDLQSRDDPRLFAELRRQPVAAAEDLLECAGQLRDRPLEWQSPKGSELAMLVYTSGTSGEPKGATTTHANIAFNSESSRYQRLSPSGGGIFALAPLFHITGLICQLGGAVAIAGRLDLAYRFEPGVVLDALLEHQPHFMIGPSTAYMALLNRPEATAEHFASLEYLYSGGAPVPPALVETFRRRFGHYVRVGYGLTETTATATSVPRHLEAPVDESTGTLSVGLPTYNTVLRIVDDAGAELPPGTVGEIVIEGPMVVPAYWNKPDETRSSIPEGRLHTGDVGFMDAQGWFYVVDRKKDMISASGYKVWPREVEDVLYGHPAVWEAAVIGVPDEYRGETVRAYVSVREGQQVTESELVDHCKGQLATYKAPRAVELLDELPKTASGKILRRELRQAARLR